MADSRSFLANQKAGNAIVGAENLLKLDNRTLHVHHFLINLSERVTFTMLHQRNLKTQLNFYG